MMKPATHSERERFVADLIRHAPAATIWHATRLMRYAGTYLRLMLSDEKMTTADVDKLKRLWAKVEGICALIHCKPMYDSTVGTLHIVLPEGLTRRVPGI